MVDGIRLSGSNVEICAQLPPVESTQEPGVDVDRVFIYRWVSLSAAFLYNT